MTVNGDSILLYRHRGNETALAIPNAEPQYKEVVSNGRLPHGIATRGLVLHSSTYKVQGSKVITEDAYKLVGTATGTYWTPAGYLLDGADDRIQYASNAVMNFIDYITIIAEVNPSTLDCTNGSAVFVGKIDNWYFGFQKTTGLLRGRVYPDGEVTASAGAITASTWAHVALTYDGANMIFYKNGVAVKTNAQTGAIGTGSNPLWIGSDGSGAGAFWFPGYIRRWSIRKVALSAAELLEDYAATRWRT